jgi:serine/threonine protein kinase
MGAVYLAEHPLIGKKVALKVIHKELATNREVVQRFFQEAKAVNRIGSEHIVEIFDFGACSTSGARCTSVRRSRVRSQRRTRRG